MLGLPLTSPPKEGGQDVPQPVPQILVAEDFFLPGSEALPFKIKPVKTEIKVSTLKTAIFYLNDGKLFLDKHLPDPDPKHRLISNQRFPPDYFTALHSLVSAPGDNYPANTYNYLGARISLKHTKLNIPTWRNF